jgi:hypothetical protein
MQQRRNARKRDNILKHVENVNHVTNKLQNAVQSSVLSKEIAQFGYQFQSFNYEGLKSHLNYAAERQFTLLSQEYNILTGRFPKRSATLRNRLK